MIKKNATLKTYTCGVLFVFALLFFGLSSNAQTIEIIPSYGYQAGSKLNYGSNYIKLQDSDQWGVSLGYETIEDVMVELSYVHQGTTLRIRDVWFDDPNEQRLADVSGDWIMLGGTKYFPQGNVRPFAGGALGMVIISPSNENLDLTEGRTYSSATRFAFSFKGGVNFMFSEHVGINIQGNLMFPVNWGGFYIGTGGGGVSVSSTTILAGVSGGLVFRL